MPIRPIRPHKRPIDGQASSSGETARGTSVHLPARQSHNRRTGIKQVPPRQLSVRTGGHISPRSSQVRPQIAPARPRPCHIPVSSPHPSAIIPAINTSNAARSISHVFLTAATSAADMPGSDHAIIVAGTSAANVARGRLTPEPTSAGNPTVMDANGSVPSCAAKHSIVSSASRRDFIHNRIPPLSRFGMHRHVVFFTTFRRMISA